MTGKRDRFRDIAPQPDGSAAQRLEYLRVIEADIRELMDDRLRYCGEIPWHVGADYASVSIALSALERAGE